VGFFLNSHSVPNMLLSTLHQHLTVFIRRRSPYHACTRRDMERTPSNLRWCLSYGSWISLCSILALAPLPAFAQNVSPGLTSLPSAEQIIQRSQDPYSGSIPQGKATSEIIDLSISDALDRGLKYNLGLYLSDRATDESRAARLHALSDLMPVVNGGFTEEAERINLKAFGFDFPGFPSSVGPFGLSELQASGTWNPLNFNLINKVHAASQNAKAAKFSYRDARDTVVLAVGANYLLTIANESRVTAAEAELKAAEALYQLAVDQQNAGLAPQIDTLRARVQLQAQQSQLIQAQNDLEKQRIALARVIGLPVQQKFRLVNRVPYHPLPEADLVNAFERGLQTRSDYQAALASLRAAQYSREAAWQQRLPSVGFNADYGVLGFNPSSMAPNWTAAATLNIPIFLGGKVEADVEQSAAVVKERQAQVDNLRASIEQDIEDAILDITAAAKQVEVAKTGLEYAQQALEQSQDRFSAGVTNNVEVIQAQQQLASANEQYIDSLYAHNIAKVLLARAIGNAEEVVKQYLTEPGAVLPANPAQPPNSPTAPMPGPGTPPNASPTASGSLGSVQPLPSQFGSATTGFSTPGFSTLSQQNNGTSTAAGHHR
jgi:outer membrane protein TolC